MNLIQQAETLKNLSDEQLSGELRMPSGGAAPFMVASEISRRKDMRARYEAEAAKRAPQTTVMDDLLSGGAAGAGGLPAGLPGAESFPGAAPGGPMMPPPQMGGGLPAQGFADGGLVDAVDYSDIAKRYTDMLESSEEEKARARALALIAAGAGMMSGGHGSTFANISEGVTAGVNSYTDALKTVTSDELAAMRGLTDIGSMQHSEELQRIQAERDARRLAMEEQAFNAPPKPPEPTAAERNFLFRQSLSPEEQAIFDQQMLSGDPNALTNEQRRVDAAVKVFDQALGSIPDPLYTKPENAQQAASDKQKQAAKMAYPQWVVILGPARANEMAQQWLTPDEILLLNGVGGAGASPANEKDPLGLGL